MKYASQHQERTQNRSFPLVRPAPEGRFGDYDESSDVDVLIVLDSYENYGREIDRTGALASSLSLAYDISVSRVILKEEQWRHSNIPLLRNIRVEGLLT